MMLRLSLYRVILRDRAKRVLARVYCNSIYTCSRQYKVEYRGKHKEHVVNNTKSHARVLILGANSKYGNDSNPAIKIPRFLRKTKDKEQIDRYYLVKKLCLEGNFDEAISNVEKWLEHEAITTSIILILNGLLHSLFKHGNMKDIVRLKQTMDRYGIIGDRSTYTVLIDSFGKMKDFEMVSKLLADMSHLNMVPHYRSYIVAAELALDRMYFSKTVEYFLKIENVHKENHDEFCAEFILKLIANKQITTIESVFEDFRIHKTRISEQTMLAIEKYFHSGLPKGKWRTTRTTVSTSGICQCCKEKLERAKFGKPEENLSAYFQKLINSELNTDTSGARWYDKELTRNDKLQELFRFLEDEGLFNVVVDGLNVAMHPRHGLDFDALFRLVEHYSSQGQKVLIIAANDLINPKRSKAVSTTDHQKAMAYLRSISSVYFVKHNKSGIDDLFLITTALHLCRKDYNVKLISNDKFMDHRANMKSQTLSYFKRWLSDHQVVVHWHDRTRMKLLRESITEFAKVVQKTENSWHFPSIDEKTWICVKGI